MEVKEGLPYHVTWGNITTTEAEWLGEAAGTADSIPHEPGGAEPWISQLVASFILARGARSIIETGCFKGATSVWMARALYRLGGGHFHICEIDKERMDDTLLRLADLEGDTLSVDPHYGDVLQYLAKTSDHFDLAWVDDCHDKKHVEQELSLLVPRMNPRGIILGHDVYGSCDLREVFEKFKGYSFDLPRLGPAGGLGVIQV